MALFDSGSLLANVALTDTFDQWRERTNQIINVAAGLSSNNIFDGVLNTFESIEVNTISGDLIPSANVTFDLGSPTSRWRDLYLAGNTIFIGDQTISANATGFVLSVPVSGNVTGDLTGNVAGNLLGNVTGDLTGNVIGNLLGNVTGDLTGNVIGNLLGNVTGDLTGNVAGNLLGNVTGDLTGNVAGNLLGNVTGDVTGNVAGNLLGDLTGNVTGNVVGNLLGDLTGNVTGNVVGNLLGNVTGDLTGNVAGSLVSANGLPIVAGTTGTLSVARGGTGITSFGTGVATFLGTPSSANLAGAVTDETGSGALVFATSPTLVTPALGTPASGVLTNATGLPLTTGVTGTLPVANGGTGQTTYTNGQLLIGNTTGNTLTKAALTAGTGITVTNGTGTITIAAVNNGTVTSVGGTGTVNGISLSGTVTSTGNLTLGGALTGVDLTTQITGTLPVANGGTGITSLGTGVATFLGTPSSANLAAAVTDETGSGALVFATSPTLVTPALGTPSSGTLTNATGLPIVAGTTGTLSVARGGTGVTTSTGTGNAVLSTSPTFTGNAAFQTLLVSNDLTISGNLIVNGTTTTINSTTLTVDDKNIEIGSIDSPSDATADGGGITLKGTTDKTFNYVDATTSWTSNQDLNILTGKVYKINGTSVLSNSTLGSGVLSSSLTSVGTITTGVWNGSSISTTFTDAKVVSVNSSTGVVTGIATTAGTLAQFGSTTSSQLATLISDETGSGALVFATSPALVTPALGTPASGVMTNVTGLPLTTGVTGTLPVANGGTGQTSYTNGELLIGNTTGNTLAKATLTQGTGITITNGTGTITIAAVNNGTVTSVGGTGTVNGITLTGTVTSTGNLTLGGTLSNVSLTTQVTGTLPVASGGTGITSLGTGVATFLGTPSSANLATAVTDETGSGALVFATSPTLVTPALGTPASGVMTNVTGLPLTTGVTGTLPVANGGTGQTSYINGELLIGNTTGNTLTKAALTAGTGITVTNGTGTITIAAINNGTVTSVGGTGTVNGITLTGTVTSTGNLTLGGTLAIAATQVTSGTLAVARGGTGITSLGSGVATFLGTPSSANLAAAVTDETGSGALVFATSPTLVTPALGTPSSGTLTNVTGLPLTTGVTGSLPVANGGTGQTSYTNGQLLIGNTTGNTLTKAALTAGTGITVTNGTGTITIAAVNNGTVTSVGGTGTVSGLTLTGTVTSTGNLTLGGTLSVAASNFASQTTKTFLAAPNAADGTPTFRTILASDVPTLNQNTTGSAATLTTARTIGGVSFNGSANINLPGVNAGGNQNTSGSAATLTTTRAINGVNFNGSAAITVPGNFADRTTSESGHAIFVSTSATGNQSMFTNTNYRFNPSTAEVSATNFNSTSDINKKHNINTIENALEIVSNLRGVRFNWNHNDQAAVGVIAQEIEQYLPEVVVDSDDSKSVQYGPLVGVLIEAIKEQQKQINQLKLAVEMLNS